MRPGGGEAVSQRVWPHPSMQLERWFSVDPQRQRVRGLVKKVNDADAFDFSFIPLCFCILIGLFLDFRIRPFAKQLSLDSIPHHHSI